MIHFLLTLAITFALLVAAAALLNLAKRRQATTNHGLTGMCHQDGGTMCTSCGARLTTAAKKGASSSCEPAENSSEN